MSCLKFLILKNTQLVTLPVLLCLQLVQVSVEGRGRHPLVVVAQLGRGHQHEVCVVRSQAGVATGGSVGLQTEKETAVIGTIIILGESNL